MRDDVSRALRRYNRHVNAAVPTYTSYEDYLALEEARRDGDAKHEWCDGAVYALSM